MKNFYCHFPAQIRLNRGGQITDGGALFKSKFFTTHTAQATEIFTQNTEKNSIKNGRLNAERKVKKYDEIPSIGNPNLSSENPVKLRELRFLKK